jgi:hypothetical protein
VVDEAATVVDEVVGVVEHKLEVLRDTQSGPRKRIFLT